MQEERKRLFEKIQLHTMENRHSRWIRLEVMVERMRFLAAICASGHQACSSSAAVGCKLRRADHAEYRVCTFSMCRTEPAESLCPYALS